MRSRWPPHSGSSSAFGVDQLQGAATGSPQSWSTEPLSSFPTATFVELAEVRHVRPVVVLDVRRASEFAEERIDGR